MEHSSVAKTCIDFVLFVIDFQNYIARFGHGSAKLARQAQSKEKTLAKMVAGGLTEKVKADRSLSFYFYSCGTIPPPVVMVQVCCKSFSPIFDDFSKFLQRAPLSKVIKNEKKHEIL